MGDTITVQLLEVLDSDYSWNEGFKMAKIPADVMGSDGKLALPAGSTALLVVRQGGKTGPVSVLKVALFSVRAGGRQIPFVEGLKDFAVASYTENASDGPAHRTVHLNEDTLISFKLQAAVSLK